MPQAQHQLTDVLQVERQVRRAGVFSAGTQSGLGADIIYLWIQQGWIFVVICQIRTPEPKAILWAINWNIGASGMKGINRAIIIGNLGKDPELRHTGSGLAIASITVATTESWKDGQTGEQKERTEWHRVSAFGRLAEIMGKYLKKGSQVYIEGKIQTRKWQDKDGQDRYTTEIIADEMQMLGGRDNPAVDNGPSQTAPERQGNDFVDLGEEPF